MPEETAECRHCGLKLRGKPYHLGGPAYLPLPKGGLAKRNFYGGWVCSKQCDWEAAMDLEASMPGCGGPLSTRFCMAYQDRAAFDAKWRDE